MLKRTTYLLYGIISYIMFLGVFVYAVGFVGNLFGPKRMDSPGNGGWLFGLTIDLGMLGLFALQHSVMARPAFKKWWTQIVPEPIERSTFVLFSNLAMILLFVLWQPVGGVVWNITQYPLNRKRQQIALQSGWIVRARAFQGRR